MKIELSMDRLKCLTSEFRNILESDNIFHKVELEIGENEWMITPIPTARRVVVKSED